MIAPLVGMTLPTVAPTPQCASGTGSSSCIRRRPFVAGDKSWRDFPESEDPGAGLNPPHQMYSHPHSPACRVLADKETSRDRTYTNVVPAAFGQPISNRDGLD